jgi:cytochrome d ubiquinol oxidase subunit I
MALMLAAAFELWRGKLSTARPRLWTLMLAIPFPYIPNTAGWMTSELGRQPWIIYGIMRTADGTSPRGRRGRHGVHHENRDHQHHLRNATHGSGRSLRPQ